MRPPSPSSLLLISLLCLFIFHGATSSNLIQETCKTCSKDNPNIKYNFCTTSLQAAPASQCAGHHGLGMISIRLVRNNVTDTQCHVKQLLKNKKLDPYVRGCLEDCLDLYSDAIPSVKQAMEHFNSQRYTDANTQISSVMDAATTCEDGFREKKGMVSPLTKRNKNTFELSAMVLSIMHMLQSVSN
ncbi:hypothetical protein Acr_08g0004490 [Actinidia rufa]|uniref:Pectinesterase inhibitor domain-containing protein n=1 Tax=Actinidia rufa TaxID=165716 RepID=A0A7J0F0B4_9ERIC|nr:hypothetical protein Acr_08g0004490 [Actinidia rufa]